MQHLSTFFPHSGSGTRGLGLEVKEAPEIRVAKNKSGQSRFLAMKAGFDSYGLCFEGSPDLFFTENETNYERLYGSSNRSFKQYVKWFSGAGT